MPELTLNIRLYLQARQKELEEALDKHYDKSWELIDDAAKDYEADLVCIKKLIGV